MKCLESFVLNGSSIDIQILIIEVFEYLKMNGERTLDPNIVVRFEQNLEEFYEKHHYEPW